MIEVDERRVDRGKVAGVEEIGYGCFKYEDWKERALVLVLELELSPDLSPDLTSI
jgi:hypothetical protein